MADDSSPKPQKTKAQAREERLKAALKANMARRKAQARGRAAENKTSQGSNEESR